ncbi:MBL fold metallo-hydrolase, partial [Streptomyces xantholiticus]
MSHTKIIAMPVLGRHAINTYLVLGRRAVVVDAGTPGNGRRIYDQVARHGVDPRDIALIVLTHGHIDHFGSATELHPAPRGAGAAARARPRPRQTRPGPPPGHPHPRA